MEYYKIGFTTYLWILIQSGKKRSGLFQLFAAGSDTSDGKVKE